MIKLYEFEIEPGDKVIKVTRKNFENENRTMKIFMPFEEFKSKLIQWKSGEYIQTAFRTLNSGIREFLLTGILPEEFDAMCKDEWCP